MQIEIINEPIRFHLVGVAGPVENEQYASVGLGLMNQMWQTLKAAGLANSGINYWVYLPRGIMFVGTELREPLAGPPPAPLEALDIELPRYLKHLHRGPYHELPQKWRDLKEAIVARGEQCGLPSVEVYGHHCVQPSELETTILIRLMPPAHA